MNTSARCSEPRQQRAPVGVLEVEAHRPLAPVGGLEERVDAAVHVVQPGGDEAPVRVAGLGMLDLDDVGAPLREHRARHRHEHVRRDLEHADVRERSGRRHPTNLRQLRGLYNVC